MKLARKHIRDQLPRSSPVGDISRRGPQTFRDETNFHFNVRTTVEKLRYIHRNPVKCGLVREPEQWRWSSFRDYAYGEAGAVQINQWNAASIGRKDRAA